ncbi:MAG: TIGR00725 family protein [candidate division Zixibacteria bacterium]|nr:TIGR00725 family protein [candidate division Zixibacteria bacterium]
MSRKNTICIGVIGAGKCARKLKDEAYEVGKAIAEAGAILVCGGMKGVMEAAAQGAREAGGVTVGIIPGIDRSEANPYCDVVVASGMGNARNFIVVQTADVIVALHGKYGTISEMAIAIKLGKPVVSLVKWDVFPEVLHVPEPAEAVKKALKLIGHG